MRNDIWEMIHRWKNLSSIIYHSSSKKKAFTFFEILIVILIVGILFVTFKSSFQVKNKEVFYAQACVEGVYGEVNNFLHTAISSKSIYSWGTQIFPDIYSISFDPGNQTITLKYDYYTYSTISLSGQSSVQYCNDNNFRILLSWDTYDIYITKWLQENTNRQAFYLSGISWPTGGNSFRGCNDQGTECKHIANFITDMRTITIQKQMCLSFSGNNCFERDN